MKQYPIKDGEVRVAEGSLAIVVGVWQDKKDPNVIHLLSKDQFITTVSNKEDSVRYHPHLFKELKELLKRYGKWREE